MRTRNPDLLSWGDYQRKLRWEAWRKRLFKRLGLAALCLGCLFAMLVIILLARSRTPEKLSSVIDDHSESREQLGGFQEKLSRQDLLISLKDVDLNPASLTNGLLLKNGGGRLTVKSSFDPALQNYVLRLLERSKTLQGAAVVLNPNTGEVLSMASYEKEGKGDNLCLKADFPAASIFKIVSAAAALETAGYTPDQAVFFRGRRHTLYKKQLEEKRGKYTSKTSFRKAFASSINPVFGKLGIYSLGQRVLSEYAEKFLFNQAIPFDLPVGVSTIQVPKEDYGLAEIASGFNKKTLISPLHCALLVSAVANRGIIMRPSIVARVMSESGEVLYQNHPTMLTSAITRGTAKDLRVLMRDTVVFGTCSKSFRPLRRKRAFRGVEFGAKTGNINDKSDSLKYDWLAAYALPPNGSKAMCVAVLIVHGEKLGVRANELGRYIINYYLSS